MGTPFV